MSRAVIVGDTLTIDHNYRVKVDSVLDDAARVERVPWQNPEDVEGIVYVLRALVEALQEQVRVADAARVVHAALQEDEGLLEAVDAAYRLGGAKAVRDLLLRGARSVNGC